MILELGCHVVQSIIEILCSLEKKSHCIEVNHKFIYTYTVTK